MMKMQNPEGLNIISGRGHIPQISKMHEVRHVAQRCAGTYLLKNSPSPSVLILYFFIYYIKKYREKGRQKAGLEARKAK
jgi:hypothetical protein